MLIDGIHIPLTVPFYRGGELYLRKLEHNVGRYSLSPVSGLVALPPDGEGDWLSDEEAAAAYASAAEFAAPEKVLVAGIARGSVRAALKLAGEAEKAGFDALLVAPPRDWVELANTGHGSSVLLFFRAVADASALPVLLWSDGANGRLELPVSAVEELAAHPNIIGLYDAGLTVERLAALRFATSGVQRDATVTTVFAPVTRRMLRQESEAGAATFVSAESLSGGTAVAIAPPKPALKTRTKIVGFQIMSAGAASEIVPLLQAGAAGAMPPLAASAPQGCYEALAAFKDGGRSLADAKAQRVVEADRIVAQHGVAAVKHGCDLNGYYGGAPRLPRLPLSADKKQQVEEALREIRN